MKPKQFQSISSLFIFSTLFLKFIIIKTEGAGDNRNYQQRKRGTWN